MIDAVILWARRGTATRALPALLAMQIGVLFSRRGWTHEWDWAFSQASTGLALVAPVVAGLVAYDRGRRAEPTLALVASSAVRGAVGMLGLALAAALCATATWCAALVTAAAISAGDAAGWPDLWIVPEGLAVIAASVAVGLAVGSVTRGLLAGPVTALALFLTGTVAGSTGLSLPDLFRAGGATGTLVAFVQVPFVALSMISLHVVIALAGVQVAWLALTRSSGVSRARTCGLVAMVLLLVAVLLGASLFSSGGDKYRWSDGPDYCARGAVTVCGPEKGRYLVDVSQASLSDAVGRLSGSGSGLDWQTRYLVPHAHEVPADVGVLSISMEDVHDDALGLDVVAANLAAPRLCKDLYSAASAQAILDEQDVVAEWVHSTLTASPGEQAAAPSAVVRAYRGLRDCAPQTWLP